MGAGQLAQEHAAGCRADGWHVSWPVPAPLGVRALALPAKVRSNNFCWGCRLEILLNTSILFLVKVRKMGAALLLSPEQLDSLIDPSIRRVFGAPRLPPNASGE